MGVRRKQVGQRRELWETARSGAYLRAVPSPAGPCETEQQSLQSGARCREPAQETLTVATRADPMILMILMMTPRPRPDQPLYTP